MLLLYLPTGGRLVRALLLLLAILLFALGLSFLLLYLFPEEKLDQFSQYGYARIILLTLFCSLTVVLPLPGTLVVIAAAIWNTALIALVASIGGALGEITGYLLGYAGRVVIAPEQLQRYQVAER